MELPKRKQHRLQGFDYSTPANYFITIVTEGRDNLFGSIVDENDLHEVSQYVTYPSDKSIYVSSQDLSSAFDIARITQSPTRNPKGLFRYSIHIVKTF